MQYSGRELTADEYRQLPGYTTPTDAWERDVLPSVAFELGIFLRTGYELIHADTVFGYFVLARGEITVKLYYNAYGKRVIGYSLFPDGTRIGGGYTRSPHTERTLYALQQSGEETC